MATPSEYELTAAKNVHDWKNQGPGWLSRFRDSINWPLRQLAEGVMKLPGVGWVIEKSVTGLVSLANDAAHWSINSEAIYRSFREQGHASVQTSTDIVGLDLEEVDRVIGYLGAKYKALAAGEGALTGVVGLPGIPPDILALVTLNLRAIGEYATYFGFDTSSQEERLFALHVLGLASSPTDAAKGLAMAQLAKIAKEVAQKRVWKNLEQHAFVRIVQQTAKALGIRLTKTKLAQIVPVSGALVGGGFNAYYTDKVCEAAYNLYRERFLAEKYGDDWIATTVEPALGFEPPYDETAEIVPIDTTPPPAVAR